MKRTKKATSILLAVCMIVSLLPVISLPAAAESSSDENALTALGFDTTAEPEGYDSSASDTNPYGVDVTTVTPVKELYVATPGASGSGALYGDNLKLGATATEFYDDKDVVAAAPAYDTYRAAAGSFTGDGLSGQVVTVAAKINTDIPATYNLDFYLTDPKSKSTVANSATKMLFDHAVTFGNSGNDVGENFKKFPVQFQNYLQITTGDFTGDGIDEIAVYIPEQGKPRVEIYQLQNLTKEAWKTASNWIPVWTRPLSTETLVPNMVSLTTGDMTGDGVDDLGITWGYFCMKSITKNTHIKESSKAVVLHGSKDGDYLQKSTCIPLHYNDSDSDYDIVRAAMALGDTDGDGKNELVLGGQLVSDIDEVDLTTRYLATYDFYNETGKFECVAEGNMDIVDGEGGSATQEDGVYRSFPIFVSNLAIVKQDGVGTQEYIYLDSILYLQSGTDYSIKSELDEDKIFDDFFHFFYTAEYGAVAGDFNGDGKETVMTFMTDFGDITSGPKLGWILLELTTSAASGKVFHSVQAFGNKIANTFAAPDTDTDTMVLRYTGKHHLTYSDPKVLAVLAAPPYFGDLAHLDGGDDYIGNSETVYGKIAGSGYSDTVAATFTVGAYISFEQEIAFFGLKAGKFETEAEITASASLEFEWMKERTQSVEYGTTGGQDTVVLYSLPVDGYIFEAYMPVTQSDDSVTWDKQTMTINIPYDASMKTLTLEDYDAIAANYDVLPTIGGAVLKSTLGDPSTYPTSIAGYPGVSTSYKDTGGSISNGCFADVGYGSSGYINQAIEYTSEDSHAQSISAGVSFKCGAGGAGVTGGIVCGAEAGYGNIVTSLYGRSFSGTVFGMPEEAEGYGYKYSWQIFQYNYAGKQTFPVVTYLVKDVASPPLLPADFVCDTESNTDNSITLSWSSSHKPVAGYQIYRHYDFPDGSGDYPVGDVINATDIKYYDAGSNEYHYFFTDTGLNPYTEYQYRIQVIGATAPYYSVTSDILTTRTNWSTGQPTITLEYENDEARNALLVYPDRDATVKVLVSNPGENAQPALSLYQWQKKVDGVWISLDGKTSSLLTFASSDSSDAGLYRCRINQIVGAYAISAYSETVTVEVAKLTATMTLSAVKSATNDNVAALTATLTNNFSGSGSSPMGTITFEITGTGYSKSYTVKVGKGGTTTLPDWVAPLSGVYQITAYYSGSRIFKSEQKTTTFLAGNSAGFRLEAAESIVYGENLQSIVGVYTYNANSEVEKAELNGDDTDSYTLGYKLYKAVNYAEMLQYLQTVYGTNWIFHIPSIAISPLNWQRFMWIPQDGTYEGYPSCVIGDSVTPNRIGRYKLTVTVDDGTSTPVDTLEKEFSVTQRPITITAPSATMTMSEATQPTTALLDITSGSLGLSDSISSLGLGVQCLNTAGIENNLGSAGGADNPVSGKYFTKVTAASSFAAAQSNYNINFIDGSYTITGATYPVIISAEPLLGKKVGKMNVFSPVGYTEENNSYQYGSQIVFVATPAKGYAVKGWQVNDTAVDLTDLTNPKVLTQSIPSTTLNVTVSFKLAEQTLTFSGTNGNVVCTNSNLLKSGATVIKNADYTFKAIPNEGYHFKEWWLITNGTTYPAGDVDTDGCHTFALTMGDVSTTLYAVFERDSYTLTLGDHLTARYMWDHDDNSTTDMVEKYVSSGTKIPGDTHVTIEASTGYHIAANSKWYLDGATYKTTTDNPSTPDVDETVYYSGQSYTFNITKSALINTDIELQHYDININKDWSGGGTNPGGNEITAAINETETNLDSLVDVAGGSKITLTATPAYGVVFEKWTVAGVDVDPDTLAKPNVYSCSTLGSDLNIVAVFKANNAYTVSLTKELHGSLSYTLNEGTPVLITDETANAIDVAVFEGDTLIFTATPDTDFMVGTWTIDGTNYQTTRKTCTLSDINSDRSVDLNFTAMIFYFVNFSTGTNGDIAAFMDESYIMTSGDRPGGGTEIKFVATPNASHMVDTWTVNGVTIQTPLGQNYVDNEYIIPALSCDSKVQVTFKAEVKHTVTITSPENGLITGVYSPDDYIQTTTGLVRDGASAVFTIEPDVGYAVDSVEVNGATVTAFDSIAQSENGIWTCTVNSANEDLDISAQFAQLYAVTIGNATGGSAIADVTSVKAGDRVNITATSSSKYSFASWEVAPLTIIDNADAASTYFFMPAGNVTITPRFTYSGSSDTPSGDDTPSGGGGGGSEMLSASANTGKNTVSIPYSLKASTVVLQLNSAILDKLIASGASKNGITIDLSDIECATEAVIPSNSGIFEQTQSLSILLPEAEITFNQDALKTLANAAGGKELSISAIQADKSLLTDSQKTMVGDKRVYDLTISCGGRTISDFAGGTATVSIPYTPTLGEDTNNIVVHYISDSGTLETVKNCHYDAVTGTVTFTTGHFSLYAVGYNNVSFTDVSGWYADYVNYLAAREIINGTGGGIFSPNTNITRAQFVTILANYAGDNLDTYLSSSFSDVATTSWYCSAVQWAYENDITTGYSGEFMPNAYITRQDIAVMITRYAEKVVAYTLPETNSAVIFTDNTAIMTYAVDSVTKLQKAGIISGNSDGSFAPMENATRAQAAKIIALLLQGMVL